MNNLQGETLICAQRKQRRVLLGRSSALSWRFTRLRSIREDMKWYLPKFLQWISWYSAVIPTDQICNYLSVNTQIHFFFLCRSPNTVSLLQVSQHDGANVCLCSGVFVYLFIRCGSVDPWQKLPAPRCRDRLSPPHRWDVWNARCHAEWSIHAVHMGMQIKSSIFNFVGINVAWWIRHR